MLAQVPGITASIIASATRAVGEEWRILLARPIAAALSLVVVAAVATTVMTSCGGSERGFGAVPERLTLGTLSGPLCKGNACRCAEPGDDPGLAAREGYKRYEVRIGPVDNELWVEVDDMVLYKGIERATECFYIDLANGKHPVILRAARQNGFAARLRISELGKLGAYDSFEFACGSPGPCGLDAMRAWRASLDKYERSVHDPCGSTRIRDVQWKSGETPDLIHPEALEVQLVLEIYDFEPRHPSGHAECRDNF